MIKIALIAHTENFKDNHKKFEWLLGEIKNLEKSIGKIKINWMLEHDDTKPFSCEVHGRNYGDVITNGKSFFEKIKQKRRDELGIHIHFTNGWRVDFSYENQERLIKNAKKAFTKAFGFEPKSFVGGWWHSDNNTIKILEKYGFKIDASPLPLYRELRIKWLFGKIPTPFKIETCDWGKYKNRTPKFEKGILRIPNAVDPDLNIFKREGFFSWDLIDRYDYSDIIEKFRKKNLVVVIPFHPHSMTKEKIERFSELFKNKKIKFFTLQEIKNLT